MKVDHYSYSSHRKFESCPKKFELSKLYPEVKLELSDYILYGNEYHREVENYHTNKVYNAKLIKAYTDVIPKDFYDEVEMELDATLKDLDTGEEIDVPFVVRLDGVNKDGLWDLKTTNNDNNYRQGVLNDSDQATLYCYVWYLKTGKIPVFNYIIYDKKKNKIKLKETYRSEKNFKEFFKKAKEFDKNVKKGIFEKKIGWQCLQCPFAINETCLTKPLYQVLKNTHGRL